MTDVAEPAGEQHPTTTHAEPGAGNPRLIFASGSTDWNGDDIVDFALLDGTTRIGSGEDADLRLQGLESLHAEIRHDDQDEYVLYTFGPAGLSNDGDPEDPDAGHVLRTAARVELGDSLMSFARDEFADHGRPFGGRQGGEFAHQEPQPDRPAASD
jgi:hypothetical protein